MMTFAFYLFALSVVVGGFMVVISRNPVHSVLWLILTFLASAGLFILLGAEFVALLLVIVYVGAVAVLFLFVVMMLDVDFAALKGELARYLPLGLLIAVVMMAQLANESGQDWYAYREGALGRLARRVAVMSRAVPAEATPTSDTPRMMNGITVMSSSALAAIIKGAKVSATPVVPFLDEMQRD